MHVDQDIRPSASHERLKHRDKVAIGSEFARGTCSSIPWTFAQLAPGEVFRLWHSPSELSTLEEGAMWELERDVVRENAYESSIRRTYQDFESGDQLNDSWTD